MKKQNTRLICGGLLLAALLAPLSVWAAGGGGHHAGIGVLVPYYVNFSLFVVVLFLLLRNPAKRFWQQRISQMEQQMADVKRERDLAQQELNTAREKLNSLGDLLAKVFENTNHEAQTESAEISRLAAQKARAVVDQAHFLAQAEEARTERSLRVETVETVLDQARQQIQERLNQDNDRAHRWAALQRVADLLQ